MMEVLGYIVFGLLGGFVLLLIVLAWLVKMSFKRRREDRGL